jgi:hypothetical protein
MSLQQLIILTAAAVLVVLALSRLVRVHFGRSPHPSGRARLPFILALLFLPPIAIEAVVLRPSTSATQLHIIESVLLYLGALALFSILMGIAALIVRLVAPGRSRPVLLLALVGSEGDPDDVPFDPALTPGLAESVAHVETANAVFPRGPEFSAQIDRVGFRDDWDSLDAATGTLEGQIADDHRLGVAVASMATTTAKDARSRLDTLRRMATDEGQAWAT